MSQRNSRDTILCTGTVSIATGLLTFTAIILSHLRGTIFSVTYKINSSRSAHKLVYDKSFCLFQSV